MHKSIRSHPIQFYSRMLSKRTSKWSWNGISNQHIAQTYFSSHQSPSSVNKSTNKSGLRRHIGFTESESHLQYLSAVLLTGTIQAQPQLGNRRNPSVENSLVQFEFDFYLSIHWNNYSKKRKINIELINAYRKPSKNDNLKYNK